MFIQTEDTPNPLTLKFIPGQDVSPGAPREFRTEDEAWASPLATELFEIDGVTRVYFGSDFLTVTKHAGDIDWRGLKAPVLAAIMEHFASGQPLYRGEGGASAHDEAVYEGDAAQIVAEIKDLLDTRIRPAVAQDGGDIIFRSFHDGIVELELHGACSGCPSSTATLKNGIENMLKHYVPEVIAVEAVA